MPVRAVRFVPSATHAVSIAPGERHVAVWDVSRGKKSKKHSGAAGSLSLEEPAAMVEACSSSGSGKRAGRGKFEDCFLDLAS